MKNYCINEEFLQQVETLELILKNNVAGMFGGNHQSKSFGSSCEFADYRDYIPGDDITKIDWNAYARFEKLYLKQYLDERQLHTKIYIDASRSMDYGKGEKATKAIELAACLAYLSLSQMDRVSIYLIRDNQVIDLIVNMAGKESFYTQIGKLNEVTFDGKLAISEALLPNQSIGYGDGLSIIISDFLTDSDYETGIEHIVSKRRDLLCLQLLTPEEIKPKIRGKYHFHDSEDFNDTYRKNINKDIVIAYKKALEYVTTRIENFCEARGGKYLLVETNKKVQEIFYESFPIKGVTK